MSDAELIGIAIGAVIIGIGLYVYAISYRKDSGIPSDRAEILYTEKTSTHMGKWAAEHQTKASAARGTLNKTLAEEATYQAMADQAARRAYETQAEAERVHLVTMNVLSKALEMNLDAPVYLEVQKKEHFDRLDLEKQWVEIEQKLRGAFIYAEREREYLKLHHRMIFDLMDERKRIETGNDPAKDDKLKFMTRWIAGEERLFNERAGLLEAASQKADGGGTENSDFPGGARATVDESEIPY